ncbi:hypothetical protein BBF93_03125 [Hyphomonas sp. CACIAM 19H1]|uniref:hypothetical protein n=1 Tax=Hyphomonas sp. CACIAM 19H1 TaxID=1873716 RepID=UPI000DED7D04|nr:hypothetical protein [Hyphomonas sp. CACIAM 19H1]AXE63319.1 hypothetical protein BBF93_03125 [Hyphomonas sp. CACIAM 19H1]
MIIRTLAVAALLAATSLSAMAEFDDSSNINGAFAQGKAANERPVTANHYWTCAAFWYVWSVFAPDELSNELLSGKLDPGLSQAAARDASAQWERQAALKMGLGMSELDAETEVYIENQTETAWDLAEGVFWGEDYSLVAILGQCATPPTGD